MAVVRIVQYARGIGVLYVNLERCPNARPDAKPVK